MNQKEYLDKLHEVQIEILDEIDRICKENNITYFLVGGTMLGAVRHNGFIPWDDDVDIGMLRADYDRFKELCLNSDVLNKKYFLHCLDTDKNYWLPFMKVRKNNTTFGEKFIKNLDTHKGIFVDIFPYDNVKYEKNFFQKIRSFLILNIENAVLCKHKLKKANNCRRKIAVKSLMMLSLNQLYKFQNYLFNIKINKNTKYIVCFIAGGNPADETLERKRVFPVKEMEFEGKMYPCIKDYDYYLKRVYGDYMKLPPKNKRVTHSPEIISFNEGKNYENKKVSK